MRFTLTEHHLKRKQLVYSLKPSSSTLVSSLHSTIQEITSWQTLLKSSNSSSGRVSTWKHILVYKFQLGFNELPEEEQEKLKDWMYDLLYTLYENEEGYTESLYDGVGWTEEVKTFLRYNANKALMNLGQDPLFPDSADDVNPIVMNGISTGTSNHDFFSQVGNGYLLGEVEAMQDDDYNYGLD